MLIMCEDQFVQLGDAWITVSVLHSIRGLDLYHPEKNMFQVRAHTDDGSCIVVRSRFFKHIDNLVVRDIKDRMLELRELHPIMKQNAGVIDRLDLLEERMEKVYNSPGMPGCVEAHEHYKTLHPG